MTASVTVGGALRYADGSVRSPMQHQTRPHFVQVRLTTFRVQSQTSLGASIKLAKGDPPELCAPASNTLSWHANCECVARHLFRRGRGAVFNPGVHMTLAHVIRLRIPWDASSVLQLPGGPAACPALCQQQRSVRAAHSADDTVNQPSDRQVSSARTGDRGHRRKSERVTIKPSKHRRSSSCE